MTRYHTSVPRGFAISHIQRTRERLGLTELVQVHHVVPLELHNHSVLRRFEYDVDSDYNAILMPTLAGRELSMKRFVPKIDHPYQSYVTAQLREDLSFSEFLFLLVSLHRYCRGR